MRARTSSMRRGKDQEVNVIGHTCQQKAQQDLFFFNETIFKRIKKKKFKWSNI